METRLSHSDVLAEDRKPISFIKRKAGALVERMVREAGIEIGTELIVNDPSIWAEWAGKGMLGIGETYMQKRWDSPCVDRVMAKLASLPSSKKRKLFRSWRNKLYLGINSALNRQAPSRELQVAKEHYNLGNEFFATWLDSNMQYSCGYWKDAKTLEEAQLAKMRVLGEKLKIQPGMRVLDIGCGWGGLGRFLIREYGAKVTGLNISSEQMKVCRDMVVKEDLCGSFECMEKSYRDLKGTWDRIVCVGMIEHVGPKNYGEFFDICYKALADDGVMALQTIGSNMSQDALNDRWITSYIFPNGTLPSIAQIAKATERKLVIEDLQNLGCDYDKTLMAWYDRFKATEGERDIGETFERMWEFYLLYSASGFRERKTQLWQFIFSKKCDCRYDAPR